MTDFNTILFLPGRFPNVFQGFSHRLQEGPMDGALILDPLNMYYYTGTMQQGVFFVPTDGRTGLPGPAKL